MKYQKIYEPVEAHQWFKNGDHPEDGNPSQEGRVVRRYRNPDVPGESVCTVCGHKMNDHGWLELSVYQFQQGKVCPGDYVITRSLKDGGGHFSLPRFYFESNYHEASSWEEQQHKIWKDNVVKHGIYFVDPAGKSEGLSFLGEPEMCPITDDFFYEISQGGYLAPEKFLEEEDAKRVREAINIIERYRQEGIDKEYFDDDV